MNARSLGHVGVTLDRSLLMALCHPFSDTDTPQHRDSLTFVYLPHGIILLQLIWFVCKEHRNAHNTKEISAFLEFITKYSLD